MRRTFVACVACGNSVFESLILKYRLKDYSVIECKNCSYVYVDIEDLDGDEQICYDPHTVSTHLKYQRILESAARKRFFQLKKKLNLKRESRILDIGCDNGYFLRVAMDHGMLGTGIEINKAAAEYCKNTYNLPVIVTLPPYQQQLQGEKFDVITLWNVIEHLPKPSMVIDSIKPLMNNNSVLIIETPTEDATIRKIAHTINAFFGTTLFAGRLYSKEMHGHTQCFSRKSISIFLNRHGFEILEIHDSTYGVKYMTKGISSLVKKAIVILSVGFVAITHGHKNHMTVYARNKCGYN